MTPLEFICVAIFMVCVILLTAIPVSDPIASMEELRQLVDELNYSILPGMVPVIVFTRPGCGPCTALIRDLGSRGVAFTEYDISRNTAAARVHRKLGRNYAGTTATMATPTTIAGLKVFRGTRINEIVQAVESQKALFN